MLINKKQVPFGKLRAGSPLRSGSQAFISLDGVAASSDQAATVML